MTIKNTKKNVSAENDNVVYNVTSVTPQATTNTDNFAADQTITITYFNFFDDEAIEDGDTPTQATITVPVSELVRLGYLEENYYDKDYIDARVTPHFEVLQSVPNKTPKQWAQDVREANKTNYIFLVPFGNNPSWEENNDDPDEQFQEGGFEEYFYTVEDNQDGTPNLATEKMEKKGSFKLDLTGYLLESNFNSALEADNSHQALVTRMDNAEDDIEDLQNNKLDKTNSNYNANAFLLTNGSKAIITDIKVGRISSAGKLLNSSGQSDAEKILVSDNQGNIVGSQYLQTSQIQNANALSKKINTQANALQSTINTNIDNLFDTLYNTDLPTYLLKSEIYNEIWGTGGFKTQQAAEVDNALRNMKLGDYIYDFIYKHFSENTHTHGNITNDGKVGSTSGLPLVTGANGVVQAGAFGTTQGTVATGDHTHGQITNDGKIGSTSGLPVITTTNGVVSVGSFGTTQGTFAEGNHSHPNYVDSVDVERFIDEDELNEARDGYIRYTNALDVCNHSDLRNYETNQKTYENILHVYDSVEDALLDYINEVDKDNACIIVFDDVGIFSYTPDRDSQAAVSGTVNIMQPDLTTAIPVSTSDLTNDAGFVTVVDLADYIKDIDVLDRLDSTATDKPLSANKGRELLAAIPTDTSQLTNTAQFMSATEIGNSYVAKSDIKNNLTDGGSTKVLSAEQGKELQTNKIDTAGTGLSKSGTTLNHSNSITALNDHALKKIKHDAQGHITSTDIVTAADIPDARGGDYTNIGSADNESQKKINERINTALGTKVDSAGTNLSLTNTTINHTANSIGAQTSGLYKVATDAQGHVTSVTAVQKADITGLGIPAQDTQYSNGNGISLTSNTFSADFGTGQNQVARGNHDHSGVYLEQATTPSAIRYTSLGSSDNLFNVTGEISFIKLNKQVICDYRFYFTTPSGSNAGNKVFIHNIPSSWTPSSIYNDTDYYGTEHWIIGNNADASTQNSRDSYIIATMESGDMWKLYASSSNEGATAHLYGQITWFTD